MPRFLIEKEFKATLKVVMEANSLEEAESLAETEPLRWNEENLTISGFRLSEARVVEVREADDGEDLFPGEGWDIDGYPWPEGASITLEPYRA